MLSVIVYGRNDSHGYNLARRAVLSLNCLAQLLDAEGDEIIFVDYNTPDDLPGFIEANRDALTARARRALRVLRVRPDQHARFAGRTHLPVLEGIARNVALRRADPANRWILSTNSDIIVTLRDGCSLSSVVAGLEDGFYHAPRYELPQIIWESLDRSDPETAMTRLADLGPRLHLNEIVRTLPSHGVDSPGDFQLALRRDLFDLRGFDEDMLLGWHLDANLARRLSFRYGPARLVEDRLAVYHCDHTRQATLTHGAGHLENDWKRFVDDLDPAVADLPAQAETWGMAGETVEEIDVVGDPAAAYFAALATLPPPCVHEYLKVSETFNDLNYPPEHVLPYLLDLLSALPRRWNLGYSGCRPRMEKLLRDGWAALGFTGEILTGDAALDRADILMFEFGLTTADEQPEAARDGRDWRDADLEKLWAVRAAFDAAATAERARPPSTRRRVVLINAIHNIFEAQIAGEVAAVHTPFSPRLRQGFLRDGVAVRRFAPDAAAAERKGVLCRSPMLSDWEEEGWATALRRGFGHDALDGAPRNLWYWERGSILHGLAAAGVLREDARVLVAAVTPEPLYAALTGLVGRVDVLDWRAERSGEDTMWRRPLSLLRPSRLHFRTEAEEAEEDGALFDAVVLPHNIALKDGAAGMLHALAGLRRRLKPQGVLVFSADVRLAGEAAAVQTADGRTPPPPWLDGDLIADGKLESVLERFGGLRFCDGPALPSSSAAAAARTAAENEAGDGVLAVRRGGVTLTRLVGVLRPADDAADETGNRLEQATALNCDMTGPQAAALSLGDGVRRLDDGALFIPRDCASRLALFGPYTLLPPGDYRLNVVAVAVGADHPDNTALEISVRRGDGVVLAKRTLSVGFFSRSPALISFRVPVQPPGRIMPSVEFQFAHFSAADIRIETVDLENASAPSGLWRDGRIDPLLGPLLPRLLTSGRRAADGAVITPAGAEVENVLWGPYLGLPAGEYRLTLDVATADDVPPDLAVCDLAVVAVAGENSGEETLIACTSLIVRQLRSGAAAYGFTVPEWCGVDGPEPCSVEVRIIRRTAVELTVRAVDLARETPETAAGDRRRRFELLLGPLLGRLSRTEIAGPGGDDAKVTVGTDAAPGCLLYGPYLRLPAGEYRLRLAARCGLPINPARAILGVEVTAGDVVLTAQKLDAADLLGGEVTVSFAVPPELGVEAWTSKGAAPPTVETRISHFGNAAVEISAVDLGMAD